MRLQDSSPRSTIFMKRPSKTLRENDSLLIRDEEKTQNPHETELASEFTENGRR